MLPMIRKVVSNFSNSDYFYFFMIGIIYTALLPMINTYFPSSKLSSYFDLPTFGGYIGYFVVGYFIQNKVSDRWINKRGALVSWLLFISFSAISVILTYVDYKIHGKLSLFMDNNYFITIVIPSISVFYLSIYYSNSIKIQASIKKSILVVGECTLGIYLLSDFFIKKLDFIYSASVQYISPLISILILEVCVFILGLLTTIILKRMPLIKRII